MRQRSGSMTDRISRREFVGAGAGTGALLALGGGLGSLARSGSAAAAFRSSSTSALALALDGRFAGFPREAEGGNPDYQSTSNVRTQPLELRFATGMSRAFCEWMASPGTTGRSVTLIEFSPTTLKERHRLHLNGARIARISTPACDAASQTAAEFEAFLTAESSQHFPSPSFSLAPPLPAKYTLLTHCFRIDITGLEKFTANATGVRPVGLLVDGGGRFAQQPFSLGFSIPVKYAPPFYEWMSERQSGVVKTRAGTLRLLTADLSAALAAVDFPQLIIDAIGIPGEDGSGPDLVDVRLACYGGAALNLAGLWA